MGVVDWIVKAQTQGQEAGFWGHGHERSGSIKCVAFLGYMWNYYIHYYVLKRLNQMEFISLLVS